jgi:hypothetical protein
VRIPSSSDNHTTAWRVFAAVSAVVLYAFSVSARVYNLTSPVTMPHHELIRKMLAVLAFALLGFALERSKLGRLGGVVAAGLALTVYSYAIEIGQIFFRHSTETFFEHTFDVVSGLAGGALGAFISLLLRAPAARERRTEAVALAVMFVLLAWGFTATYGRLDYGLPSP